MAAWLPEPNGDLRALRRLVSGLVTHRADDLQAIGVPDERLDEIDSRYAEVMLERLKALDGRNLTEARNPIDRIVGCCRDFTVLYLTLLRNQAVPVRARVGFASYFAPGWYVDHEVAEVWDQAEQRWRLVDPEARGHPCRSERRGIVRQLRRASGSLSRGRSGLVVVMSRRQADPERFVVDPGLDIPETRGWLQIKHNLIQVLRH